MHNDTIAAVATASGIGSVGIVRISGPDALKIGEQICRQTLLPRNAYFTSFKDQSDQSLDEGIALYFKAPASFTGEDVVELQGHGGALVLDLLLKETLSLGARTARPGEFSERAFLNDKIDLVQAEAIADLIETHSESALKSSLKSLHGEFSNQINALVDHVTKLRKYVEAAIDFPEEEIDFITDSHVNDSLSQIIESVKQLFKQAKSGAVLNQGLNVAIIGKPNAGKSSLLNALAADDIAIVTEQAGTTRDIIKQNIVLDGIPLTIIDTAGLRESNDIIEQEGIKRIKKVAETADVVFYLRDASKEGVEVKQDALQELMQQHQITLSDNALTLFINNKIDLCETGESNKPQEQNSFQVISISAKQRLGLEQLANAINKHYEIDNTSENTFTARRRHLKQIEIALESLTQGQQQLKNNAAGELLAEDLRQVQNALGEITGKVSSDDLLGEIFSSFCIGK